MASIKTGADLKVGDVIRAWGRTHRITELAPHPVLPALCADQRHTGRVAKCDTGFGVTVFDNAPLAFEVVA